MPDEPTAGPGKTPAELDTAKVQAMAAEVRAEQNLPAAVLVGLIASLIGAVIWAAITVTTGYQIGWMAVGVGALVGISVQLAGHGVDPVFGFIGAGLSLLGCALGNLLAVCGVIAMGEEIPYFDLLLNLNPAVVVDMMKLTFSPMDLLFYGIALYEGYRLSIHEPGEAAAPAS